MAQKIQSGEIGRPVRRGDGVVVPKAAQHPDAAVDQRLPGSGSGLELEYPARLVRYPAWVGHIPFAFWIVSALRPRILVELGVHSGNSYCAFLQAVRAANLEARCFGIDHWQGDEHAGFYGDEVYRELHAYHEPLYGSFSTLMRSSFDDALGKFDDASIDILHIDGLHTYDAVSRDFANWLPKMSSRGVMLFHDTNVRERNFGIWRVWEEIAARFPCFEFLHSHGLGLAYVGSEPPPASIARLLGAASGADGDRVRTYFARLGASIHERFELGEAEAEIEGQRADLAQQAGAHRALVGQLHTAEVRIAEVAGERAAFEDQARAAQAGLAEAANQRAAVEEELRIARATIAQQAVSLGRLERSIQSAQAEIVQIKRERGAIEAELMAARAAAAQQAEVMMALEAKLRVAQDSLAAAVAAQEANARIFRQQMTAAVRLKQQLIAAARQRDELELETSTLRRQLQQVFASRSWRLTAPLRFAVSALRNRKSNRLP